jgi:dTMP kinase
MFFCTVEGIDGAGKSTVIESIQQELEDVNVPTKTTREPSPNWTGPVVRQAIDDDETHPMTDLHFFVGDRAYHIKHSIAPALQQGKVVISDRYSDSTRAYQQENIAGFVSEPRSHIEEMLGSWHLEPDLTLLLDVPAKEGVERASDDDKYEVPEFLKSVRNNYLELADEFDRIITIDATQPEERVCNIASSIVLSEIPEPGE